MALNLKQQRQITSRIETMPFTVNIKEIKQYLRRLHYGMGKKAKEQEFLYK